MDDPIGAETSEASDALKEEPYRIMTINMECWRKLPADDEKELIISTIEDSSASVIFCQKAVGNFKTRVVEKCVNDGSRYQFVPKNIRSRKDEGKVAVMWREKDFEGKEVEVTASSSTKIVERLPNQEKSVAENVARMVSTRSDYTSFAMVKLTSKGTTKASFLAVSWHGPENVNEASNAFYGLIFFVREVCKNEKLSWFIIGGCFNFDTSKVTELKDLVTISRCRSFFLCKVSFAEDIKVSDVKVLELENESRYHPQLKYVPIKGVLKLVQDRDLPGQMFVKLQQMQRDVSKVSSNTDLLAELEKIASDKGFEICDNEGLGNCIFYALSEQLNFVNGIKISHGELRQSIVQYLRKNPKLPDGTDLFNFIDGYQSWADYLSNMEQDGKWGDHMILYGTANCYKTCIDVISSQSNHSDLTIRPDGHVINTKPLVLGHIHELHYVSLQPKQASTPCSSQSTPSAIPDGSVTREDFERLSSLVEGSFKLIDAKIDSLAAEVQKMKLAPPKE